MARTRDAIESRTFAEFRREFVGHYRTRDATSLSC
jgi:queuine/archaeosine tRNA-ribosyltransferase